MNEFEIKLNDSCLSIETEKTKITSDNEVILIKAPNINLEFDK